MKQMYSPATSHPEYWIRGRIILDFPNAAEASLLHVKNGDICCIDHHHPEEGAVVIENNDSLFVPAFADAHVHLFDLGFALLDPDLTRTESFEEAVELIRAHPSFENCHDLNSGGLFLRQNHYVMPAIIARGYDESRWANPISPTRTCLDNAFPDRPVVLVRRDYHSLTANSAGLIWLNMASTYSIQQKHIHNLSADCRHRQLDTLPGIDVSSGMISGEAAAEAWKVMGEYRSDSDYTRATNLACSALVKCGVAHIHALFGPGDDSDISVFLLDRLKSAGQVISGGGHSCDQIEITDNETGFTLLITPYMQTTSPRIASECGLGRMGGCIMLDGSTGSRTAALNMPYADKPGCTGNLYFSDEEVGNMVRTASEKGMQIAFHAIGDKAIDQAINAYKSFGNGLNHRIEHLTMATPEQIESLAELGITPVMQPAFEALWGGPGGLYHSRLGDRGLNTNPVAGMIKAGMKPAGGSDTPITPPDPLFGIKAAMNRPDPAQQLEFRDAMAMFSTWTHRAAGRDAITLKPGMPALLACLYPFDHDKFCVTEKTQAFLLSGTIPALPFSQSCQVNR